MTFRPSECHEQTLSLSGRETGKMLAAFQGFSANMESVGALFYHNITYT